MRNRLALLIVTAAALRAQGLPANPQPIHLTLAEAQRLAVRNNPRPLSANLQAQAAHQDVGVYNAARLPSLTGNLTGVGADNGTRLSAGSLNNPTVYSRAASGFTLSQLLTDFGRTGNLVNMSRLQAQASDQNAIDVRATVILGAAQAYYEVMRAQALLTVANQTVQQRQTVSGQITALANSKLKSTLDVSFADYNLADSKILQAQAESDVHASEAQLAEELGLPQNQAFVLDEEPVPAALSTAVADLIAEAMQNRPDLKNLRLQQSAAERFASAEHDLFYPTVEATGMAGGAVSNASQITPHYEALGVNVSIPVFNGGLFRARSAEAQLKAKAAAQNVSDLANRIARDVRIAYLNAATAYQRIGLTEQLLKQANLALDLSQSRYDVGLGSIVELSQAQLGVTSARIQNTAAKYDYQSLRTALDFQMGLLR